MPDKCTDNPRDCAAVGGSAALRMRRPPCEGCPLFPRVEALERANEQHGSTHRELFDRLRELERLEGIQGEQYKNILEKLDNLTRRHDELNRKLSELEAKPARRWEALVEKALWAVAAAVIAFLLGRVGL